MILNNIGFNAAPAWCVFLYDSAEKRFRILIRRDVANRETNREELVSRMREDAGIPADVECSTQFGKQFGFGQTMTRIAEDDRFITYVAPLPKVFITEGKKCKKCKGKRESRDGGMCFECAGYGLEHTLEWNDATLLMATLSLLFADMYEEVHRPNKIKPIFNQPISVLCSLVPGSMFMNGEFSADFTNWIGLELDKDTDAQEEVRRSMERLFHYMMCGDSEKLEEMHQFETKIRTEITGRLCMQIPGAGTILVSSGERNHCGEGCAFHDHDTDNVHQLLIFLAGLGMLQKMYLKFLGISSL